jgi:CubicO group peptidase (beta-lactamase class C family)
MSLSIGCCPSWQTDAFCGGRMGRSRTPWLRTARGFCQAVYGNGAFGWNGGFGTSWLVDPVGDLAVIVLTQRLFESPEPPHVHVEIQTAALETV